MALIVPAAAQAAEGGASEFSLPPGATMPAEFSPPPGATFQPATVSPSEAPQTTEFSPPPGATLQPTTVSNPVVANPVAPAGDDGFDLGDAGIGAAILAGAAAVVLAGAAFVTGRRRRLGASHS
jgi:hypothetical protein